MTKETILVVEDDPQAQQLLTDILQQGGYHVLNAQDGAQGLALAKQERPDLILMDVQLPGLNGLAVARRRPFLLSR